jgi:putative ABC transport system permease protein
MPALPRLPLALRILLHNPRRLAVSVAGVTLAAVLMFSQTGFRNAMYDSQTEMIRHLDGELMIVNRLKYLMFASEPFPARRVRQARACPGVRAAYPLYLETERAVWRNARDGSTRPIRVLGVNPDDPVLDFPEVAAHAEELKRPDTVLFDEGSRDYYGRPRAGTRTELSRRQVEVVGTFRLGTDFLADGSVIMSDENFRRFFPDPSSEGRLTRVQVGVVRLEAGADAEGVRRELVRALPEDVSVLTRQELVDLETRYWDKSTAIGYIFPLGMAVGLVIGVLICFQILFSNVSSYLPQFATLKAMGFTDGYLVGVVLQQGLFLAVLGFIPAVGAALALFWVVSGLTGLLMFLTPLRAATVLALTVAMCMVAGVAAVRDVLTADPAEVFR